MAEKEARFEIGRLYKNLEFHSYHVVTGEEAAMKTYREQIRRVASPEEIRIFDEGGAIPRKDLEDKVLDGRTMLEVVPEKSVFSQLTCRK